MKFYRQLLCYKQSPSAFKTTFAAAALIPAAATAKTTAAAAAAAAAVAAAAAAAAAAAYIITSKMDCAYLQGTAEQQQANKQTNKLTN